MTIRDSFREEVQAFLQRHHMDEKSFSHAAFEEGIPAARVFEDHAELGIDDLEKILTWMRVKDSAAGFESSEFLSGGSTGSFAQDRTFGEYDYDRRIEIYKVMIDSTEKAIERRQALNRFYFSVVVAIFVSISFVLRTGVEQFPTRIVLSTALFLAFLNCILWFAMIYAARRLNATKYDVIGEMEQSMEFRPFSREWEIHVQKRRNFPQFTLIEIMLPAILSVVCLLLFSLIATGLVAI